MAQQMVAAASGHIGMEYCTGQTGTGRLQDGTAVTCVCEMPGKSIDASTARSKRSKGAAYEHICSTAKE